jgi:choloylglycine hydrolase
VPGLDISTTVHLALDDATGDSAVIEYLDGAPVVHHGREHTVMTNSPPFDQQTDQLKQYEGFGGQQPLPGTTEPADRFVRASYYVQRLPPADTADMAYAELLSVMRNAAQPFGTVDPDRPNVSATMWRTLTDLTNRIYGFESSFKPNIIWTHLDQVDFTRAAKLDLTTPLLVGDVTAQYTHTEPFRFASA